MICMTVRWRSALSGAPAAPTAPAPGAAEPRLMLMLLGSERVMVPPAELRSMKEASRGSMMFTPDEEDERRLVRAEEAEPVRASRASTRSFSRFTSSPRAMSPTMRPTSSSESSSKPSSHFHRLQHEPQPAAPPSLRISA